MNQIGELVGEEHELRAKLVSDHPLSADEARRLEHLEEQLDQCWDLLRQRRARRSAGQDPEAAGVRDPSVVEHYQQ